MSGLKTLVLSGYGLNCEAESKYAIEKSGGSAEIVHLNKLIDKPQMLEEFNMLLIPGGFSFGDDLGSGKVFGNKMKFHLSDDLLDFINAGKLVLGVCNGFQIMVKMGLLPSPDFKQRVTLIGNDSGHFEDRWVLVKANKRSPCIFTKESEYLLLPVRHGEGKFIPADNRILSELVNDNSVVLQYVDETGNLGGYPYNPNGSVGGIAGICDKTGRIFGLMPHPEAFNIPENCPYWPRGSVKEAMGLRVFRNAVKYAESSGI